MTARTGLSASWVSGTQQTSSAKRSIWGVALGGHREDLGVPGAALHHVADELVVDRRSRRDRDQRALRVEQRDRPVLELARGVALGVDVADLLQLERALERRRIRVRRGRRT